MADDEKRCMGDEQRPANGNSVWLTVLGDLLEGQRDIQSSMVTKKDLTDLKTDITAVNNDHEKRISVLERDKLPKWFWPTVAPFLGLLGTVAGWLMEQAHHTAQLTGHG